MRIAEAEFVALLADGGQEVQGSNAPSTLGPSTLA
jgi:hypothetical protein